MEVEWTSSKLMVNIRRPPANTTSRKETMTSLRRILTRRKKKRGIRTSSNKWFIGILKITKSGSSWKAKVISRIIKILNKEARMSLLTTWLIKQRKLLWSLTNWSLSSGPSIQSSTKQTSICLKTQYLRTMWLNTWNQRRRTWTSLSTWSNSSRFLGNKACRLSLLRSWATWLASEKRPKHFMSRSFLCWNRFSN